MNPRSIHHIPQRFAEQMPNGKPRRLDPDVVQSLLTIERRTRGQNDAVIDGVRHALTSRLQCAVRGQNSSSLSIHLYTAGSSSGHSAGAVYLPN